MTETISAQDYRDMVKPKKSKYRNKKTKVGDLTFDSRAEAARFEELLILKESGVIRELELQPRFPVVINGKKVFEYRADFRYVMVDTGVVVIEDVKSPTTAKNPTYRVKKKVVEAVWDITITEYIP